MKATCGLPLVVRGLIASIGALFADGCNCSSPPPDGAIEDVDITVRSDVGDVVVSGLGLPLAVGRVRGVPSLIAAEVNAGFTGALLIHLDPFGEAPSTERVSDVLLVNETIPCHVGFADLDDDGDVDLVGSDGSVFVVLDDTTSFASGFSEVQRSVFAGRAGIAIFDIDEDGDTDAVVAGLNGEAHVVDVVDGGARLATRDLGPATVGDLGYCASGFHATSLDDAPALLMIGEVCAAFGTRGLSGFDRLFRVDPSLGVVESAALGLIAERVLSQEDILHISSRDQTMSMDVSGGALTDGTAETPFEAFGFADLKGDGTAGRTAAADRA